MKERNYTTHIDLDRVMDLLESYKGKNSLIFVEGKKDMELLIKLGFEKENIIRIQNNRDGSIYEIVEKQMPLRGKSILILTDFDNEGQLLAERLASIISEYGGNPQLHVRTLIYKLLKGKITQVEGISHIIRFENYRKDYFSY
ncbi:MAG: hypothetical protein ACP6IU_07185 [Candidatus Asgardarchaeia archaeon]